ncbi:DUF4390 domain-containing protein [Maridesulfovibrio hydrothermalis]|uniref:DUF4390 domain-containing protein n=1 Tax=Maridesulfovibrio hydrothermalis AM13 = DSM 14728 TaxID=1121451 RepID=L0RC79_9BACT|nr:DUF4390 domain-containing protein [Maridesulfovibrio hydrothermalis]CCO23166.1 conserved exported protein of unknown function [Maridesulfovibrio hydrothermalis AM13 = DSM 14728]
MTAKPLHADQQHSYSTPEINIRAVLLCMLCLLSFFAAPADAGTLQLKNMVLDNQAGSIMARFGIFLKNDTLVEDALLNGVRLKLECEAELLKHKSLWPDSQIARKTYSNKLYFDSLSKQFVLEKPGADQIFKNESLTILLREKWRTIVLDLGPWSTLERDERYKLRLKVRLDQTDIPAWLKNTLFFWSWDVIPSVTYQLDFTY